MTLEVWGEQHHPSAASLTSRSPSPAAPAQNQSPVASFTDSCSNFICSFDATGSTDDKGVVSYEWSLGKAPDGSASGPTVTTDYGHASTRTVTLTVTDAEGLSSSVTKTIDARRDATPTDAPPSRGSRTSCERNGVHPRRIDVLGRRRHHVICLESRQGTGRNGTGVSVTTDYWHTSTRTVTLTVTDTKGQTNSVTQTVMVP